MNNFDDIITFIKEKYNIINFAADSDNCYKMLINGKYTLCLTPAKGDRLFFLYSEICIIPAEAEGRLLLCEKLLQANLFGHETHHAFFAIDDERGVALLLQKFQENGIEVAEFEKELQDFVNCLGYWDQKIEEIPGMSPIWKQKAA